MSRELANEVRQVIADMPKFAQVADKAMVDLREKALGGTSLHELGIHDPRFAKQILQMTSYTMFGFGSGISDSQETGSFEDKDVLRGILLAYSLQGFISQELKAYGFAVGELWEHSMNCGLSSWMIATKTSFHDLEQAFVVGIMHDIGKIVLDRFLYEENKIFVDIITEETMTPFEAERALLGIDHAEAGALLAEKWKFDSAVIEAIRYHHQPEMASEEPDLTVFVHLADCMCMSLGYAVRNEGLISLLAGGMPMLGQFEG